MLTVMKDPIIPLCPDSAQTRPQMTGIFRHMKLLSATGSGPARTEQYTKASGTVIYIK